jgi:hypothetical protein
MDGSITPAESKLLDKLKEIADAGKGKSPSDVLREMGKYASQTAVGAGKPSTAFAQRLRQLAGSVRNQTGGAQGSAGADPNGPGGGNGSGPSGDQATASTPPPTPEGRVMKLEGAAPPQDGKAEGTDSTAGGVPGPGGRMLPGQARDTNVKRDLQQHYRDETARYLSHERVPAEYRDLIKDYFSY